MNQMEHKLFGKEIQWLTKQGKVYNTISDMDSDHIVNVIVMLFNHIVLSHGNKEQLIEHKEERTDISWYMYAKCSPLEIIKLLAVFTCEIEDRGLDFLSEYALRRYKKYKEKMTGIKIFKELKEAEF